MTDFKAKVHQIRFRLRLRPRTHWGSIQRSQTGFGGASRQGRGWAGEEEGNGKGEWRAGKGKGGPQVTVEPGPLRANCYATGRQWSPQFGRWAAFSVDSLRPIFLLLSVGHGQRCMAQRPSHANSLILIYGRDILYLYTFYPLSSKIYP